MPKKQPKRGRRWLNDGSCIPLRPEHKDHVGKLRGELLNREIFTTLTETRILIEQWRKEYNQIHLHSSLGYQPPAPEATILVTLT